MQIIGTIFKKELRRVLFDRKMVMALFVLPVVIMVVIYGVMGLMMKNMQSDIEKHESNVVLYQAPESFESYVKELHLTGDAKVKFITAKDEKDVENVKTKIKGGEVDLMIAFPDSFDQLVKDYKSGDEVPEIMTFYNPSEDYSSSAKESFNSYLEGYRTALLTARIGNLSDIQIFTLDTTNKEAVIQDENKAGGKMLGMILPYMICMLLFAGIMSLGTDAIAGEKERGTMATLLVAPVKRSQIVYGKLLALMVLAAMSAMVYGISMLAAFPTYAKTMGENGMAFHLSIAQGVLLLGLIVSLVFVYVAIISVCSVFAKNMKEASSYVMPAYMIVIVTGMMSMFVSGDTPWSTYCIPLYGSSMALRNILTQEISNPEALIAIGINLVFGAILAAIVTKAFDNERVMFDA